MTRITLKGSGHPRSKHGYTTVNRIKDAKELRKFLESGEKIDFVKGEGHVTMTALMRERIHKRKTNAGSRRNKRTMG